ncbi:MAG: glycoside hydrolase family 43 protein [Acidimicrobiales bacterium]
MAVIPAPGSELLGLEEIPEAPRSVGTGVIDEGLEVLDLRMDGVDGGAAGAAAGAATLDAPSLVAPQLLPPDLLPPDLYPGFLSGDDVLDGLDEKVGPGSGAGSVREAGRRRRRHGALVVACVLAAVGIVGGTLVYRASHAGPSPLPTKVPALPKLGPIEVVDSNDVGDPSITLLPPAHKGGPARYFLVYTTDWQSHVPAAVSTDLVHWTQLPDALPALPPWALPTISMTWAPSVVKVGKDWVMYYSTEARASQLECIGRAVATNPTGPYIDNSTTPLVCQTTLGGSIDPSVVTGPHGGQFLVWKNNGNAAGLLVSIWSQQTSRNGLSLVGPRHQLLSVDATWQAGIMEGPSMVKATKSGYWLFYAAGYWRSDTYSTGLAWCPTVGGPCKETSSGPFLASTNSVTSPGGLQVFTDSKGHLWIAVTTLVGQTNARHPGRIYYNRVLDIARVLAY